MADYFAVGSFRDVPSWHGKEVESGGIFTGNVSIPEIMEKSGMDYQVEKIQIGCNLPDGSFYSDEGRSAIMRPPVRWEDKWERLRIVGNRYEPIQNIELANILEPLNKAGWGLEGTAILKNGMICFVELKLDEYTIGNQDDELHKSYLLVSNDHAQGNAVWGLVNTRVVCWNTYQRAVGEGIERLPHTKDTTVEMDFRAKIQLAVLKSQENEKQFLESLFTKKVDADMVSSLANTLFPNPESTRKMRLSKQGEEMGIEHDFMDLANQDFVLYNTKMERAEKLRNELVKAFGDFNDQYSYAAHTAYGLLQAVTGVTNHSETFTGSQEKGLVSLFYGQKNNIHQMALAQLEAMR